MNYCELFSPFNAIIFTITAVIIGIIIAVHHTLFILIALVIIIKLVIISALTAEYTALHKENKSLKKEIKKQSSNYSRAISNSELTSFRSKYNDSLSELHFLKIKKLKKKKNLFYYLLKNIIRKYN